MERVFKAPKFELKPKRVAEIPFRANLAAGAMVTLNSLMIQFPFKVTKVKMIFTDEANNLIIHQWHVLTAPFISAIAPPLMGNLFTQPAPPVDFVGRAIIRVVPCNVDVKTPNMYLALYTNNTSPYAYDINCSVTIEEL